MPIKNYTTKVAAAKSIQEIQDTLVKHGATGFFLQYEQGKVSSLKFVLEINNKQFPFQMPVDWKAFQQVLKNDRVARWNDDDYCYRVAWRVIRDWVAAQMALFDTQMVSIPQIFLPYAVTKNGNTLFQEIANNPTILLTK